MVKRFGLGVALVMLAASASASAQVSVGNLSVREPGPRDTQARVIGDITSPVDDYIMGGSSPSAKSTMAHMVARTTKGGVMKPAGIPLKANVTRRLSVYGYHIMLMGFRAPLKAGDKVPLTITFQNSAPVNTTVSVTSH